MTTASDIVYGALRLCSSIMPGEAIAGSEAENALTVLNGMIAGMSAEGFMPPSRTVESFAVSAGVSSRTIGSGAQINTVRPDSINYIYLVDSGNNNYILDIMTQAQYNAIVRKDIAARPQYYYFDPQYPNAVIYFDSVTPQDYTLTIDSQKPISQFSSLSATMVLPGEYYEMLKYNLALRLSVEYGFQLAAEAVALAEKTLYRIKRKNIPKVAAAFDAALLRPGIYFDINRG